MFKTLRAFLLVGAMMSPMAVFASDLPGYENVPSQSDRKAYASYTRVDDFPAFEFIAPGHPVDSAAVALLKDELLKKSIQTGSFQQLKVSDLFVRPPYASFDQNGVTVPFAVSVMHTQSLCSRGTIDVAGALRIETAGNHLTARVIEFTDSSVLEKSGRAGGCNADITLDFATKTAAPAIEGYYNADPQNIAKLLSLLKSVGVGLP